MASVNKANQVALWERHRFSATLTVLLIFYAVGTIGILSSYSQRFVQLSFVNLALTALLLLVNAEGSRARVAVVFALSMVVGFAVEALGVRTGLVFGDYHYTTGMGPSLVDVPLVIGLNWAMLVHSVHASLAERLRFRGSRAMIGATAMTVFDWVMEPVAIRLRFWVWQSDTIPQRNYLSWWILSFVLLSASDTISPHPKNRLAPWVFGVMLMFFAIVGLRLR